MARELPVRDREIVPAGLYRVYAEQSAGMQYNIGLPLHIEQAVPRDKCEVEIAEVVVDSTSARHAARKVNAVALDRLNIALSPRILIFAYYHGVRILP